MTAPAAPRQGVRARRVGALMIIEHDGPVSADMGERRSPPPQRPAPAGLVHVDVDAIGRGDPEQRTVMRLVLRTTELERVARLRNLQATSRPNDATVRVPELLRIGSIAIVGLVDVARAAGISASGTPPTAVALAREYLHRHWNGKVRASEVSDAVGMHRVHLARQFRRWFEVPIMTYLYDLRVEHAVRSLATTAKSAATVAAECGFADQSHLTRRFAGNLGIPPAELRRAFQR